MKKGIMTPFFSEISMTRRLDMIKEAGFKTFMLSLDPAHEIFTAPIGDIINHCKNIGLEVSSAHAACNKSEINEFWKTGKAGVEIENQYLKDLIKAAKHGINTVVFHLHYGNEAPLSAVGIERLRRMTNLAEVIGVNIAIENYCSYNEFEFIFSNINSKSLGICYDTGHENLLTPNADFIFKYGNRLKSCHIHDNDGETDQHKTPFTGNINWDYLAKGFAKAAPIALEAEVRVLRPNAKKAVTEEEFLAMMKREYAAIDKFEKMAKSYQKNKSVSNNSFEK